MRSIGDFMAAMNISTNITTFDASFSMHWAHYFLSLITRPITSLKTLVATQQGLYQKLWKQWRDIEKERGLGRKKMGIFKGLLHGKRLDLKGDIKKALERKY